MKLFLRVIHHYNWVIIVYTLNLTWMENLTHIMSKLLVNFVKVAKGATVTSY